MKTTHLNRTKGAAIFLAAALLMMGCACPEHKEHHARMSELFDEKAVIDRANELFICTDKKDWKCVKDIFAPQVLFDMTSLVGGQPTMLSAVQIAGAWEKGLKDLSAVHHQVGNYKVSVSGSEADVFSYGIAYHYLPNPTERNSRTFVGSYNLHLVRSDKEWKIDRFKFNLKFIDGNKDLEGAAKK